MPKARVKLSWKRSVSPDVTRVVVHYSINGEEFSLEMDSPDVQEMQVVLDASSTLVFSVESFDREGNKSSSLTAQLVIGDLIPPQPATDLNATVIEVIPDIQPERIMLTPTMSNKEAQMTSYQMAGYPTAPSKK